MEVAMDKLRGYSSLLAHYRLAGVRSLGLVEASWRLAQ
jgi:hypothetical protein